MKACLLVLMSMFGLAEFGIGETGRLKRADVEIRVDGAALIPILWDPKTSKNYFLQPKDGAWRASKLAVGSYVVKLCPGALSWSPECYMTEPVILRGGKNSFTMSAKWTEMVLEVDASRLPSPLKSWVLTVAGADKQNQGYCFNAIIEFRNKDYKIGLPYLLPGKYEFIVVDTGEAPVPKFRGKVEFTEDDVRNGSKITISGEKIAR